MLRALTTQVPQTADAKDIILITDEQEATDDSRKRPRSEAAIHLSRFFNRSRSWPARSRNLHLSCHRLTKHLQQQLHHRAVSRMGSKEEWETQMRERYPTVEAVRQAKLSGELYSSLGPEVPAGISNQPIDLPAPDVVPPIQLHDATLYMKPSCPELSPHTIGRSDDGSHLVMTVQQGGGEAKLPLVPLRGHEFKEAAGNTMYVTTTKKNILHKLSGILRGHGSAEFLQKFDNLYVHISDAMDEFKRQLPYERSLVQPWSIRTWIGIIANGAPSRSELHKGTRPASWKVGTQLLWQDSFTAKKIIANSMSMTWSSTGIPVCR